MPGVNLDLTKRSGALETWISITESIYGEEDINHPAEANALADALFGVLPALTWTFLVKAIRRKRKK